MTVPWIEREGRLMVVLNRWALRLAVLALAMAAASCTSKPSPKSTPTPSTSLRAPSSTASPVDPKVAAVQDAVAAYRGMWQAYSAAVQVPNPDSPDLSRYATGNALHTLVTGLKSVKDRGLKGTGAIVLSPQVTQISPVDAPTKVGIRDCFDDGGTHLVRASPGLPYNDTPGGRRLCLATVERQADSSWKVTGFGLQGVGTC
jgi:hypothetical protein